MSNGPLPGEPLPGEPLPGEPLPGEPRDTEAEPEEIRQRLRASALAGRPGLAPGARPEPDPPEPEPEQQPEGPLPFPWAVRASWAAYVLELMALGIPVSLAVRWLMERLGTPIIGPWGPDDWVATGMGWALTSLVYSPLRRHTWRFLKAQAELLQRLAERMAGRDPEGR